MVAEVADDRDTGGVAKVLVDEQVDGVRRVVVAAQGGGIHSEWALAVAEVKLNDGLPRLDEVVFHSKAVSPAYGGVVVCAGIAVELHVRDHARQHLPDIFATA
ncbi:hypothetical protein D3C86_1207960 [compost metagenome]